MRFNGIMARRAGTGTLCRWYREPLVDRLQAISDLLGRLRLIEGDGVGAIRRYGAVAGVRPFVDPPYERTGWNPPLYARTDVDHRAVFAGLWDTGNDFLTTYGDTNAGPGVRLQRRHDPALGRRTQDRGRAADHQRDRCSHDTVRGPDTGNRITGGTGRNS